LQHKNSAIESFVIQIIDDIGQARDIWKIENPVDVENGWQLGQVKVVPISSGISYWVLLYLIFSAFAGCFEFHLDNFCVRERRRSRWFRGS